MPRKIPREEAAESKVEAVALTSGVAPVRPSKQRVLQVSRPPLTEAVETRESPFSAFSQKPATARKPTETERSESAAVYLLSQLPGHGEARKLTSFAQRLSCGEPRGVQPCQVPHAPRCACASRGSPCLLGAMQNNRYTVSKGSRNKSLGPGVKGYTYGSWSLAGTSCPFSGSAEHCMSSLAASVREALSTTCWQLTGPRLRSGVSCNAGDATLWRRPVCGRV